MMGWVGLGWVGLDRIVIRPGQGLVWPRCLAVAGCLPQVLSRSLFDFCITSVLLQFLRISTNNQICIPPYAKPYANLQSQPFYSILNRVFNSQLFSNLICFLISFL